jgi:preprotein translocase subunit SecF
MAKRLNKKYHLSKPSWLSPVRKGKEQSQSTDSHSKHYNFFINFYDKNHNKLLILPLLILFLSIAVISYNYVSTGEIIDRSVSLKGGITLEIYQDLNINNDLLASNIESNFAGSSVDVGTLRNLDGSFRATTVYASDIASKDLLDFISSEFNINFDSDSGNYQINEMESTFSKMFFSQLMVSLFIAFLFMAITVFIIYKVPVPSIIVVFSILADIIEVVAVFIIFGISISAASIAAFMMLIGYSVDTNILLSTKVLKQQGGSILDKIVESMKTGMMMVGTAFVVVLISYFLTQSSVLKEIMLVIMIGTLIDAINTWITNARLLRMYMERKK